VDELRRVAGEAGETPARVALAWVLGRPGVTSVLMGASRAAQVADNAAALEITLAPVHRAALDEVSAAEGRMLYGLFTPAMRKAAVFGGATVAGFGV
jgi:aryl-alcohol dehydrogenase-like predicted oxidoreductase